VTKRGLSVRRVTQRTAQSAGPARPGRPRLMTDAGEVAADPERLFGPQRSRKRVDLLPLLSGQRRWAEFSCCGVAVEFPTGVPPTLGA
jgi:hypothetical protein